MKKITLTAALLFAFFSCSTDEQTEEPIVTINTEETTEETSDPEATYVIGDQGPAGGFIIFDKGQETNGWRYIEVAPNDISGDIQWGCGTSGISNAVNIDIGDGLANSIAILEHHNNLPNYYEEPEQCNSENNGSVAAKIALEFELNGFDDWHLPSINEGLLFNSVLFENDLGNFIEDDFYWTSTQHPQDVTSSATIWLGDDSQQHWGWVGKQWDTNLVLPIHVRPVRYF